MKKISFLLLVLFLTKGITTFAQCGVEAGNDVIITCGDTVQLNVVPKWVQINNDTTRYLCSVFFTDTNTGYAVGYDGIILKTIDGGTNWMHQTSGTQNGLTSVYFINADTGYAVGGSEILKTTNGGINWTTIATGNYVQSVFFTDANTGYCVGGYDIIKTIDGGINWTHLTSNTNSYFELVNFTNDSTGYVYGNLKNLKTTDAGATWDSLSCGMFGRLISVNFTTADTGYAVVNDGTIIKTADGGLNWTIKTIGTNNYFLSAYFIDVNTTYIVGVNGKIFKTNNTGTDWIAQASGTINNLSSVYFTDANTGFAVGDTGIILKLNEPVSYSWTPANGLSATNIANPTAYPNTTTTYFVTSTTANGCIATDSITIIVNPLTIEAGSNKTIICGKTVQLDSVTSNYTGTGILSYNWSPATGLNNNTISNPTANVIQNTKYYVTVTSVNGCTAIDSVMVIVNPLTISGTDANIICGNNATLNTITNYTGTGLLTYSWLPATGLNSSSIANPVATVNSDQTYTVTVTTPNGCVATDDVNVSIIPLIATDICLVGVDSSNKNMLVWNKPVSSVIDTFFIYRETNVTNVYQKIGTVSYDSMSVFVDTYSFPDVQSNKYKISIKDNCGLESDNSAPHKTMHLSINQGMGTIWNLGWEAYEGFAVSTYNIYRGSTANNLQLIGTTSGSNTSYSDLTAPSGFVYYQVEVVSPNACNPSKSYNSSRSNISTNNPDGIYDNHNALNLLTIYPNPASDIVTLKIDNRSIGNLTLNIYNVMGSLVKSEILKQNNRQFSIGDLSNGVYMVTIKSEDFTVNKRLVIQR